MCHHWGSDGHVPKYRTFFFYEKAGGYTKHCMQNITDTRNQEPPIQTGRGGAGRGGATPDRQVLEYLSNVRSEIHSS